MSAFFHTSPRRSWSSGDSNSTPSPVRTYSSPRIERKRTYPPSLLLGSIEEEKGLSEYDCGYLDLGTESPASESTPNLVDNHKFVEQWAAAGVAVPSVPARPSSGRASSTSRNRERTNGSKRDVVDRDCGICFEYAVVPCRTLCCGKIFCTEHLSDWLHGPNAAGRCPNCENACSLEGGTLSLAVPPLRTPAAPVKAGSFPSSPLILVQSHSNETLTGVRDQPRSPGRPNPSTSLMVPFSTGATLSASSSGSSTTTQSSALPSDSEASEKSHRYQPIYGSPTPSSLSLNTTPFSTSWGPMSRLMSIVTFLMFLYKLLS